MTTGQTYRQKLLQTIEIIFMFLRLLDGKDAQSRKDLDDSAVAYAIIASSRYLSRRTWGAVRSVIPSYPNLFLENKKHHLKQKIRMTWDGFQKMIDAFKDHEVFDHATQGYPAQLQFLVAFHHFGCDGNGASVGLIADYFGISGGSADNFTWSVVKAILAKEREYVYWPSDEEKDNISRRIYNDYGFPSCVGFVDGTLVGLDNRPSHFGEEYYSHKGGYGVSTMLVCDDMLKIRYVSTGWPGCWHDNRVYSESPLHTKKEKYFRNHDYILADSAYTSSPSVVPAFKTLPWNQMDQRHSKFNMLHSKARVKIEHCNGALKGEFQSLKAMRIRISSGSDAAYVSMYIRACCVLHNTLLDDEFETPRLLPTGTVDDFEEGVNNARHTQHTRRNALLDLLVSQV